MMRTVAKRTFVLCAGLLVVLSGLSCEFDEGLGVLTSGISGTVTFIGPADRPSNVDEVRVVVVANFPPQGLSDVFFSEALPFDGDSARYELSLPLGEYAAVAALWKPRDRDWSFTSLLGVYGFDPPLDLQLLPVQLTRSAPFARDVRVPALWSLSRIDGEIRGEIEFRGARPENTETLLMGAFSQLPNLDNITSSLLFLGGLPLPVSDVDARADFLMPVRSGPYPLVGVFWKGRGIPWDQIRLIGFYQTAGLPGSPQQIDVPENGSVEDVSITVDYGSLPDGLRIQSLPTTTAR